MELMEGRLRKWQKVFMVGQQRLPKGLLPKKGLSLKWEDGKSNVLLDGSISIAA